MSNSIFKFNAKKLFLALESSGHYHENLVASLSLSGAEVGDVHRFAYAGHLFSWNSTKKVSVW